MLQLTFLRPMKKDREIKKKYQNDFYGYYSVHLNKSIWHSILNLVGVRIKLIDQNGWNTTGSLKQGQTCAAKNYKLTATQNLDLYHRYKLSAHYWIRKSNGSEVSFIQLWIRISTSFNLTKILSFSNCFEIIDFLTRFHP